MGTLTSAVPMDPRLLALAIVWLVGWYLCWRVRVVPYAREPEPLGAPVSVVIPARDEERTLPTVLAGLASQTAPPHEVIVVDDGSTDTTAAVAAARGAEVLAGEPLPAGWAGKPWAVFQGARAARAPVVLSLDADVDPSPHLLARLVPTWVRRGGLLSVQPYHEMRHWWERAAAFFNLVAVMGVGLASPGSNPTRAAAFGPCFIARRDALLTHLDHRSVRRAVIEDVALARRFAAAHEPVTCFAGGDLVAFRMYDRPDRLLEGFAKNFAAGAAATPLPRLVAIVAWVAACLVTGFDALGGSSVALLLYAAFAVQCFVMLRQLGNFGIAAAALYPVLAALFVAVFLGSLLLTARGQVRWKGRTIRLRGADGRSR
jgi:4,4'-diaponeurosporenoate glycosyltransferase